MNKEILLVAEAVSNEKGVPKSIIFEATDVWEYVHQELEHTFFRGVFHLTVEVDKDRIPRVIEWTKESSHSAEESASNYRNVKARMEYKTKTEKVDEFEETYALARHWKFPDED